MRRVSLEGWLLLVPAAALLLLLIVLAVSVYGYEPPRSAQYMMAVAFLAGPVISCGVIVLALILRLRGALSLKHPYVFAGLTLACLNVLITVGAVLVVYLIVRALGGGSLIFG